MAWRGSPAAGMFRGQPCIATGRPRLCPNAGLARWILATTPPCWSTSRRPSPRAVSPARADVLWGTDMTQSVTLAEGVAHVFVAVDHCNSECVGIHTDKSANRFQALEPVRQGVRRHFGAVGKDVAAGLMLRHDHGPNYMSDDFQSEIAFLGIEASPSFVRQPEGNGVAERFIRTLKENLLWVRHFETVEELRLALLDFATWYNTHWLVARHGHRTPAQIRADQQPAMDQAA